MRLLSGIATFLVATFALASTFPVDAAPIFVPKVQSAQSDVIQIRDGWHRGYRHYRGYHQHDDFWATGGAFVAGALLGSVLANDNGYYGGYYRGDDYYGDPYYGDRYYVDPYYHDRYYADRYYGNGYYSNRSYRPCSPREADSGNCY
ncbi:MULTISPECIES: BA14K family protein [unclassified Mesorhizobium]|uniref:BA14K family protein n=1 Tax=unclassified Mesorhizobium TaxID=325217 RepID=UPI000FCA4B0A|nr:MULTISPECIES: BA14K family protein [unclassified Mesorhizobium]TGP24907.1 BA14K family protein [Mesorhizobium sp. M1D.F.Ca.ET.231.01.1.1]TGP36229.1 BA14K family protein [Mesorhizobium sp. M1D.F.Ca.ET.234.01.1.1]TGS49732.1 BA14K family protein [Mesorhizobium sp. M1D.F.Ca.ET.184.01.1.1]TGS64443.1 BA14K family protein [Mesorhizobium sp. M1D.F.Ca.ET.183.01.1.1]